MDLLCSWATANAKTTVSSLTRGSEKVNSSQSPRCNKKPLILDGRLPHISCRCRDKALGTECFLFFDLQPLTPRSSLGNSDWLLWIISCCSCSSSLYLNCCRTCWDTEEVTWDLWRNFLQLHVQRIVSCMEGVHLKLQKFLKNKTICCSLVPELL